MYQVIEETVSQMNSRHPAGKRKTQKESWSCICKKQNIKRKAAEGDGSGIVGLREASS